MRVELLSSMGDDLMVVNAARVSHFSLSEYSPVDGLRSRDAALIRYLAKHEHDSPFYHPQFSFRVTAPIYVARQLMRHHIGLAVNEVSRRYVSVVPNFDLPDLRARGSGGNKQGSDEGLHSEAGAFTARCYEVMNSVRMLYADMCAAGVAPECARAILPMATETEWIWTGSLFAFANMHRRRCHPDAQRETANVVHAIGDAISIICPVSWEELTLCRE